MMSDFREIYLKVRDEVATDLIAKYNLSISHSDNNRLTLDNSKYSIHITFSIPEGDGISISDIGKKPGYGISFMAFVCKIYPKRDDMILFLKNSFADIPQNDYSYTTIKNKLNKKITFLEKHFPEYFRVINT